MENVRLPADRGYRPGYEVVSERLLELIASAGLRPGDSVGTEARLAERLGVSRTVVREAVKTLTAVGRLRAVKGKGIYVADDAGRLPGLDFFLPANIDHVRMLFEFRMVQETAAARLAATRATPPQLRRLRGAAERSVEHGRQGYFEGFGQADEQFHVLLAEASGNRFLTETVRLARRLQGQAGVLGLRSAFAGPPEQAGEEHRRIAEAVAAGDEETAMATMCAHIEGTRAQWERTLAHLLASETDGPMTAADMSEVAGR